MSKLPLDRRSFLAGSATAAATTIGAPAYARSERRWKMVTCWQKNFPGIGTGAQRIADRITELSDGELTIKLFAAGEFVPAFEVFDAVREGKAEMGHDSPYYWISKNRSTAFFGSVPGGLAPLEQIAWIRYGGGQELWDELYSRYGLKAFVAGNAGMQMIGWFRKRLESLADLQGLRVRMAGLQSEVLARLGATTINLPGGEVMPSLQSGVIDAAEWGGPWMDLAHGFYKVAPYCYGPGVHEPGTTLSLMVNKEAFEELPKRLQSLVQVAAEAETTQMLAELTSNNALALERLIQDYGATIEHLPADILARWFEVSDEVVAETAADDEINQRIYDNWSDFRRRSIGIAGMAELGFLNARAG